MLTNKKIKFGIHGHSDSLSFFRYLFSRYLYLYLNLYLYLVLFIFLYLYHSSISLIYTLSSFLTFSSLLSVSLQSILFLLKFVPI